MGREHHYQARIQWTGNRGTGTSGYRDFDRAHDVTADGKPTMIPGSSDPAFRGDPERWNPEELLVVSLSQCHMLWYLHLCATNDVVVVDYVDEPTGTMAQDADGGGHFTEVVLRPKVTVSSGSDPGKAHALHPRANELCFIARSVNFPVRHEGEVLVATGI
jgi:organic hydroperoxide reductase OsmC/OhrA